MSRMLRKHRSNSLDVLSCSRPISALQWKLLNVTFILGTFPILKLLMLPQVSFNPYKDCESVCLQHFWLSHPGLTVGMRNHAWEMTDSHYPVPLHRLMTTLILKIHSKKDNKKQLINRKCQFCCSVSTLEDSFKAAQTHKQTDREKLPYANLLEDLSTMESSISGTLMPAYTHLRIETCTRTHTCKHTHTDWELLCRYTLKIFVWFHSTKPRAKVCIFA